MRKKIDYNKILWNVVWKEGKYYVSQCLNVDISSFGKTKKEALDNLNEALELYFDEQESPSTITNIESPEVVMSHFRHA